MKRQRVRAVDVRSVARCAVATWPLRRPSPSCRHCASSVHARCPARCCQDTSRRCARTGSSAAALPNHLAMWYDVCSCVCLPGCACDIDDVRSSNVTSANVFAVCSMSSSLPTFTMSSTSKSARQHSKVPTPTSVIDDIPSSDGGQRTTFYC